jgi:hypothetical protein
LNIAGIAGVAPKIAPVVVAGFARTVVAGAGFRIRSFHLSPCLVRVAKAPAMTPMKGTVAPAQYSSDEPQFAGTTKITLRSVEMGNNAKESVSRSL